MVSYYQDPKTKLIYNKLTGELAPPRFQIANIPKKETFPSQQSSSTPSYTPPTASPSLSSNTTWYYVQKPSGICERLKISENLKQKWEKKGWKISLTNICKETPKSGCSECESCDPMKIALGTCDCGVHCGERKPTKCYLVYGQKFQLNQASIDYYKNANIPITPCEDEPKECPTCSQGYISIGVHGSILDPCRCVKETEDPCTKPCKDCDSAVCKECDAWDIPCERCRQKNGTCTNPTPPTPPDDCGCTFLDFGCKMGCWWEKYGTIIMIIGGLIGLGIVLWLLRPLFSVIGSFKGGSP